MEQDGDWKALCRAVVMVRGSEDEEENEEEEEDEEAGEGWKNKSSLPASVSMKGDAGGRS